MVEILEWDDECPYCGSSDINSDDVYELEGEFYNAWRCEECNKEWASS